MSESESEAEKTLETPADSGEAQPWFFIPYPPQGSWAGLSELSAAWAD